MKEKYLICEVEEPCHTDGGGGKGSEMLKEQEEARSIGNLSSSSREKENEKRKEGTERKYERKKLNIPTSYQNVNQ
jgi:hypothetical protein